MKDGWSFKQHFSLRASTMLLVFCASLVVLAFAEPLYNAIVEFIPLTADLFWRFGVNFERYLLISCVISLFFLGRSMFRKEPQVQFVIEILVAGMLYRVL